jgi:molybdopterin/thiamine biosynthesis adenylyltransferase
MAESVEDAIKRLGRHPSVVRVGTAATVESRILVEADIRVELPSRSRHEGRSATGVRELETSIFSFTSDWPLAAPQVYLRPDFPLDLPHINPHRAGQLVSPCIFEGALDELLQRFGLDAVVDQLVDWLHKAAAGTLINLAQGWEPTRRDSCPSTIVFSAEQVAALAPLDGSPVAVSAGYLSIDGGVSAIVDPNLALVQEPVFDQKTHQQGEMTWASGRAAVFVVRAPLVDGRPQVDSRYQPETVADFESLLVRAADLGIDRAALAKALDDYYRRSIFGAADDPRKWIFGLYAVVVLAVQRPVSLVGAPGRSIELLPYVARYAISAKDLHERSVTVHPAFHAHALSPELLARTSGRAGPTVAQSITVLGCGSLGSKISLHLGRAGFGNATFVDNEALAPHNSARHALLDYPTALVPKRKANLMREAFTQLSHADARAFDVDAVMVLRNPAKFAEVVPQGTVLVLDATASLKVLAAQTSSQLLTQSGARLARTAMYGQGRCAMVALEGRRRIVTTDDLSALLFESCRWDAQLRAALKGTSSELTRVFVGDNCRSLTAPMSDATVSRSAALVAMQLERWLAHGLPDDGQLGVGVQQGDGIGMTWSVVSHGPTTVLRVADDGGWTVRVLAGVRDFIDADAIRWDAKETGGALIGHVSHEARTIVVAGLVQASADSHRSPARFVLGTEELKKKLRQAHEDSVGYLMFVGTWHTHPRGGMHSGIDRGTLGWLAEEFGGLPVVSLIWTPDNMICAVDRR